MAKLQNSRKVILQPDVPNLIHDVILSLCQRKYADISDVEVDGIICISFRGLSEQQVIKIHENLTSTQKTSVDSEGANKVSIVKSHNNEASEHTNKLNELDLQLEVENVNETGNEKEKDYEMRNSQTENENEVDSTDGNNYRSDISFLSSLLKTTNDIMVKESGGTKKKGRKTRKAKPEAKAIVGSSSRRKRKHPVHHPIRGSPKKAYTDESLTDSRAESNDFSNEQNEAVHPAMVVIKQEPLDSDETNPKIVDVFSAVNESVPSRGHVDPLASNDKSNKGTTPNEYDGALSERQNQESLWQNLGLRRSASVERPLGVHQSKENNEIDDENNMNIVIKQERIDENYGAAYGGSSDDRHDSQGIALGNDSAHNDEYPDFFHITDYFEKENADQENGSKDNYTTMKKSKSKDKTEAAASKKWFETVKKNMNKYQAALLKSVQITKKGSEGNKGCKPRVGDGSDAEQNNLVNPDETPVLKSILETPQAKDIPERDTDSVIKKENVGDLECEGQEFGGAKPKLVTKYPALFSHLKKSKEAENQNDMAAQPDSLVNRLPFLSFKDLFAQASPNTSSIDLRPSPERLANLLSQPSKFSGSEPSQQTSHINIHYSATDTPTRRGWNWKKRAVRPKGPNGEILTHLPPLAQTSEKPVGIANPKRQKSRSKDEDHDWRPNHGDEGRRSDSRGAVSTRLSSGRSRRTNFTEYSDSDIEEIEIEQDQTDKDCIETDGDDQIQMVLAYCRHNCGNRFDSIEELSTHEEACHNKGFTCEFCGLDFNQQYRWQYHMIKVHGVSVDSAMFR